MAINSVQLNIDNKAYSTNMNKPYKPYLNATDAIETESLTKPLPPNGYLIHDNLGSEIKYFFKDIAYDFKSIKNGFNGTANDHQLGRLNDIGLKVGGIGIATYLASQTTNPKARLMEYIGLGAFLTSMSIFPKLAINTPAKLKHGFDIDKEYIDDQGRKKSVMQDSNYIPYDMYLGEIPAEDLEIIGDRMGIPRDIKNRNDVIKEQMRKISTQNNTLWMLTAGFATPIMTALICCGLENYVVGPGIEKARSVKYNKLIANLLQKTSEMEIDTNKLKESHLSESVNKILSGYIGQELPKEEFETIYNMLREHLDNNISESLKEDLTKLLSTSANSGKESIVITSNSIDEMLTIAKNSISGKNKKTIESILLPTESELETILKTFAHDGNEVKKGFTTSIDNIEKIKQALKDLFNKKIEASEIAKQHKKSFNLQRDKIIERISKSLQIQKSSYVTQEGATEIVNLAKIIEEFKENQKALAKCKSFKFEHAPETVLARSYEKFEKTLLKELGFSYRELEKMKESGDYTKKILDKKFLEISKDENKFKRVIEKLGNVLAEMELSLHGGDSEKSVIQDLINAIENNYNNTARRLANLDSNGFSLTIKALVEEDVATLKNTLSSRNDVFDFLDGTLQNKRKYIDDSLENYVKYHSKGAGSSKYNEIMRIFDRYQGVRNSFDRIIHALDVYRRGLNPETFAEVTGGKNIKYVEFVIQKIKDTILTAASADYTLKLDTINNPLLYKDIMNAGWAAESGAINGVKQRGLVSPALKETFEKIKLNTQFLLLDRHQFGISRFRNIVANSTIDFPKPHHIIDGNIRREFTDAEKTRLAFFNLIGQTPVELVKGAAKRKYNTQKWVRTVSAICASVLGVTVLTQLGFGKLSNPQNLQKQVNNEQN